MFYVGVRSKSQLDRAFGSLDLYCRANDAALANLYPLQVSKEEKARAQRFSHFPD